MMVYIIIEHNFDVYICSRVSTGVRVLLRRHVLQHDGADEPDERGGDDHAEKSYEPHQRAEDKIGGRLADGRDPRVTVSAVFDRSTVLDTALSVVHYTFITQGLKSVGEGDARKTLSRCLPSTALKKRPL